MRTRDDQTGGDDDDNLSDFSGNNSDGYGAQISALAHTLCPPVHADGGGPLAWCRSVFRVRTTQILQQSGWTLDTRSRRFEVRVSGTVASRRPRGHRVPLSSMLWLLSLVAASPHPTYVALGGSNTAGTQRGSSPGLPGPQTALLLTRVSLALNRS